MEEEAEKLIEKFELIQEVELGNTEEELHQYIENKAKECALLHCDLMIEALDFQDTLFHTIRAERYYMKLKETIKQM